MGLFNRLGREAEKVRQQIEEGRDEEATHRCRDCEELFYADHETCPECGGEDVTER